MKARRPIMSKKQKKAMDDEITRQILEQDEEFQIDDAATTLWALHLALGLGAKRLRRVWETIHREHRRLREFYEMSPDDVGWLCRRKLKEIGVDIEEWFKEPPDSVGKDSTE